MVLEESDLALETLNLAGEDVNILGCGSDNPQLSYGTYVKIIVFWLVFTGEHLKADAVYMFMWILEELSCGISWLYMPYSLQHVGVV